MAPNIARVVLPGASMSVTDGGLQAEAGHGGDPGFPLGRGTAVAVPPQKQCCVVGVFLIEQVEVSGLLFTGDGPGILVIRCTDLTLLGRGGGGMPHHQ